MSTDTAWAPPSIDDLCRALEQAGLEGVSWQTTLPGSSIEVSAHAWARRDHEEQGAAAARRSLYELAEHAITLTGQAGFHPGQPHIVIAHTTKPVAVLTTRSGYELTLTLTPRPHPAGDTHTAENPDAHEGAALLAAFGGGRQEQPWSTELHQDGTLTASSTGVLVSDALSAARTAVAMAAHSGEPWRLDVRGPHGAQATFRTLTGYETAAAATTWHQIRDAYWNEIKQLDRPGDPQ
jgi:hypothetical protein